MLWIYARKRPGATTPGRFSIGTYHLCEYRAMRRFAIQFLGGIVPAFLLIGCGGESSMPSQSALAAPHGGHMVALPENRGVVEIKSDRPTAPRGSRTPATKGRILAYFYQADGSTRMSPAPTDVKIQLGVNDKTPPVVLAPEPKEAGLFASEPGMYPDGFRGQIEAKINGEPVKAPFMIR